MTQVLMERKKKEEEGTRMKSETDAPKSYKKNWFVPG